MNIESTRSFNGHSFSLHISSDSVHINVIYAGQSNMAAAIEFTGVPELRKAVITLDREDIDTLLLQKIGLPI